MGRHFSLTESTRHAEAVVQGVCVSVRVCVCVFGDLKKLTRHDRSKAKISKNTNEVASETLVGICILFIYSFILRDE